MGKKEKNTTKSIKEVAPRIEDDQLGENASGIGQQDEIYKKEHHKKEK